MKHWHEAQEERRREGTNAVFLPKQQAAITGHREMGWLIVTPLVALGAQTEKGVELVLEELCLPALGWQ